MASRLKCMLTMLWTCVAIAVSTAHAARQSPVVAMQMQGTGSAVATSKALNTYYIQASSPLASLKQGGRPGTTRLTLQLREKDVNRFMPVVTASKDGLVHNVVHTFKFLKVRHVWLGLGIAWSTIEWRQATRHTHTAIMSLCESLMLLSRAIHCRLSGQLWM